MRIVTRRDTGKPFVIQSASAKGWEKMAVRQLREQSEAFDISPEISAGPVQMRAVIYRERRGKADLLNFLAAISDALEAAEIIEDDKQVLSVDGSRLMYDKARPRVEITLLPLTEP